MCVLIPLDVCPHTAIREPPADKDILIYTSVLILLGSKQLLKGVSAYYYTFRTRVFVVREALS
jgi:hypothetical protein